MAKERVFTYRNTGTESEPLWEKWYGKTVADAVMMTDGDSETRTVESELNKKVDKVAGKQLSTEDFTTAEKTKLAGLQNFQHSNSGVTAGTYKSVTVNAQGHVTAGTNPTTLSGYGITDAAAKSHTHGNADITALDAGKITSGTISIDRLPKGALERCVVVADDAARFKLTTATVQVGDTVKVTSTGLMYFVVDDSKLSTEAGYEVYTAGSATSVPWSGVTGKPSTFTPSAHSHDDKYYTESEMDTKLGTKVDKVTGKGLSSNDYTDAEKSKLAGLNNYSHPTTAGNKHIPAGGASGQILRWSADGTATWGADNNTTYTDFKGATSSSAGTHGLVPAPAAGSQVSKYLRADGTWQMPPNTTYNVATGSANGLMSSADKSKLDGVAANANNYVHPSTHPASMITQDATHRFATDSEKAAWNAKPEVYFASQLPTSAPAGSICFLI